MNSIGKFSPSNKLNLFGPPLVGVLEGTTREAHGATCVSSGKLIQTETRTTFCRFSSVRTSVIYRQLIWGWLGKLEEGEKKEKGGEEEKEAVE